MDRDFSINLQLGQRILVKQTLKILAIFILASNNRSHNLASVCSVESIVMKGVIIKEFKAYFKINKVTIGPFF